MYTDWDDYSDLELKECTQRTYEFLFDPYCTLRNDYDDSEIEDIEKFIYPSLVKELKRRGIK